MREKKRLEDMLSTEADLVRRSDDISAYFELAREGESVDADLRREIDSLRQLVDRLETETLLSGENDARNAIVTIHPGAGGTESQDWADMLLRMYLRWAERQGFETVLYDYQPGEEAGLKSATFAVNGEYAFGLLTSEIGVHRLVRISPFDQAKRRHTSFASVYVSPEIDDSIDVVIKPEDLRIDTYRSSGKGGQHVNTTDSAVRITHIPTGHRGRLPERAFAAQEQRPRHEHAALQALRVRDGEEARSHEEDRRLKTRHRLRLADSLLRAAALSPDQRPPHQDGSRRRGPRDRRRSAALHPRLPADAAGRKARRLRASAHYENNHDEHGHCANNHDGEPRFMPNMLELIRASAVPATLVQSAAKGSLALPPRDMLEILVYLAGHNPVFGEQAQLTLADWDEKSSQAMAADPHAPKEVLEYLISPKNLRPALLPFLLENRSIPEAAIAELAASASRESIEVMLQSPRVSLSPRILNTLASNPNLSGIQAETVKAKLASPASDPPPAPEPPPAPNPPAEAEEVLPAAPAEVAAGPDDVLDEELTAYLTEHAGEIAAEAEKPFQPIGGIHEEILGTEEPLAKVAAAAAGAGAPRRRGNPHCGAQEDLPQHR